MSHLHFNWSRLDVFATDAFKTFLNVRLKEKVSPSSTRSEGSGESAAKYEEQKEGPVDNQNSQHRHKQHGGGLAGGLIQALIVAELTMGNIPPLVKLVALDDGLDLGEDDEDNEDEDNDEDTVGEEGLDGANRDRAGDNIGARVCDLNNAATTGGKDGKQERENDNGFYNKDEGRTTSSGSSSSGDDMSSYFNNEDESDCAEWDNSSDAYYGVLSCWDEGTHHEGIPALDHDVGRGTTTAPAANNRDTACPTHNSNSNGKNNTDTLARVFGPKGLFLKFRITYGGNAAVGVRAVLNHHIKLGKSGEKKGKRDDMGAFDLKVGATVGGASSGASPAAPPTTPSAASFLSPSSGGGQAKATTAFPSRPLSGAGGAESQSKVIVSPTGSPSSFAGAVMEASCGAAGSSTSYADSTTTTATKHTVGTTSVVHAHTSPHVCADGRGRGPHQKLFVPSEGGMAAGTRGGDASGYFSSSSPSSFTPPLAAAEPSTGGALSIKLPNTTTPTTAGTVSNTTQSFVEIDVASFDYLPAQHRPRSEERAESRPSPSDPYGPSRDSSSPQRSLWETNTGKRSTENNGTPHVGGNKLQHAEERDTNKNNTSGGCLEEPPFGVGVCIPAHVALSGIVFDGYLCVNLRNNKCDIWLEPESSALLQSASEWNATYERRMAEAKAKKREERQQAVKVGRDGDQINNNTTPDNEDDEDDGEDGDCEDVHDLLIPPFDYPTPLTRLQVELLLDGVREIPSSLIAPPLLSRPLPPTKMVDGASSSSAATPVVGVGSKGRNENEQVIGSSATREPQVINDLEENKKDQDEDTSDGEDDDEEEEEERYNTYTYKGARHVFSHAPRPEMRGVSSLPLSGNGDAEDDDEDSDSETDLFGGGQQRGEATAKPQQFGSGGGGLFGYTAKPSSRMVAPFGNTRKAVVGSLTQQQQSMRLGLGYVSSAASSSTLTTSMTATENTNMNNTILPRRHQGGNASSQEHANIAVGGTSEASPPPAGGAIDTHNTNTNKNNNDNSRTSGNNPQSTTTSHLSPSSSSSFFTSSSTPSPPPRFFDHQLVTELVYNELQALLRQHILMPRYVSIPLKLK